MRFSRLFIGFAYSLKPFFPFLGLNLRQAGIRFDVREYLAMCVASSFVFFIFGSTFISLLVFFASFETPIVVGLTVGFIFSAFVFVQQISYPGILSRKKVRSLEQNLLPALQNMLIQLNSGVPTFNILVNIASGDYGEVSKEFARAVKEINAGRPQVEVLEELASDNPSTLFRRTIWQVVNGMKAGSDMARVINDIINRLSEQQLIQIQNYGGQLSPLAMFYMLVAVIVPSLSVTFIIILSSFISLGEAVTKLMFWGLFIFVVFLQVMFMGIIKSRRPNLLT
ncbi:MAG: type II secretion system F family protein [archaeon]